jgi:uncharacterized low-complexity protein
MLAASLFAVAAVGTAWVATNSNDVPSLLVRNVEALAQGEGGSSENWSCWSQEKSGSGYWRCGSPCQWIDGAGGKGTEGKCYSN